ncbi:DUF4328 domain-containing protein [Tenggerimyces flavus]|uniref:DUF4328 domain-containing protein n=1 Tax=Tenggerimyces flavus TaxID=1708749 RepID=A0ABV7YQF9_9ACTN|nr:DUF4328 domain-containing protein [Tenggerimyces flavus]MBM7784436.1 hypothetical protein [Tenggerimyces flavus]
MSDQPPPYVHPQPQPTPWASPAAPLAPPVPPKPIRPINGLAVLAVAGLVVWFLTNLAAVVVSVLRYFLIEQFIVDQNAVPIADLEASDAAYQLTGVLELAGYVVAGVLFIVWLFRARANAEAILPFQHRLAKPWLVFGWIVPIIAWWFPKNIVDDIWKTSDPAMTQRNPKAGGGGPKIVLVWWLVFLLGTWVGNAVMRSIVGAETLEDIQVAAGAEVVLAPVSWAGAILAVVVIARLSKLQESQRLGRA